MNKSKGNISIFIGNDSTSTMVEMCRKWKKENTGKVIAFDPIDSFAKAGLIDYSISMSDKKWAVKILKKDENGKYKFENSLLILQDYRMLMPGNATPADFLDLIQHKKRMGLDMMISTSTPKDILERLSYFVNDTYVFESDGDFSEKIPNYFKCQRALELVNEYVRENHQSHYVKSPHIIVRSESDEIECINMPVKKAKKLKEVPIL